MKIVSIGDLVTDYYYQDDKLLGVNGGMTSHNIIANLTKFDYQTKVVGACGNDSAGEIAIKSLDYLGVDTSSVIKKEINTRCFHISYFEKDGKLDFTSKKRCPICNNKKWYDMSEIDPSAAVKSIEKEDLIVIDNLNSINMKIIAEISNDIMLDLGQYFELENKLDEDIVNLLKSKFCIIQMNERVENYLLKRFNMKQTLEIYNLIQPKLLVITRGKKGADFVYNGKKIVKPVESVSIEIDSTGAGDAFFSCVIDSYIKNNFKITEKMITAAFEKASKMTAIVVSIMGARGHLNSLYKIEAVMKCSCESFKIKTRKKIKRVNININSLKKRVLNSLNSDAVLELPNIVNTINSPTLFIGTGGSFAAAYFASRVINEIKRTTTLAIYPREILFRNNDDIGKTFLFSYSGTTADLISSVERIEKENIFVITKGEKKKVVEKAGFIEKNIVSYNNGLCKGKERGFLSFEGAVAPAALFLSLLLKDESKQFINERFDYWQSYFEKYFRDNKTILKKLLSQDNVLNIFKGDYTNTAALDMESKIIESGIYNIIIHEKKNFSHGRFINLEHQQNDCYLYLKQKNTSKYETELIKYLNKEKTILIQSEYNGLKAEFDLLIASQYFMYNISSLLNIDISKPEYSDESMKIYFYKGEL